MVLQAHTLYQPAIAAYQRAIRLEPKEFSWRYYLALSLQQSSSPEQALSAVSDALKIRPGYAPAILKRAELLFKQGRFKESDASLSPLLARDPDSAPALYLLARIKYAEAEFPAAEDLYRRACQAYPNFGAAWYGLAETGKRIGHTADSAKYYALAESHKNDNPPDGDELFEQVLRLATGIENRLAQAKQLMGQRKVDEASRLYKEVLKPYPDNPDSLVNLLYIAQFPNQATPEEAAPGPVDFPFPKDRRATIELRDRRASAQLLCRSPWWRRRTCLGLPEQSRNTCRLRQLGSPL
jgi:tetratricopeptide (TPR) repeat protein